MLPPDDRAMLLELLEPPAGFGLDAAAGVTYTLDLDTLLTLPTAFALKRELSQDALQAAITPLELLDALRSQADKITVCCDASGISLPPNARAGVLGFLERSIVPVRAPRGGTFHPKLWVLRFSAGIGEPLHRIVLTSRNLTFDRSWDTVVCLEQDDSGVALPAIGDLLVALAGPTLAVGEVAESNRTRLESLGATTGRARFGIPDGFDFMALHVLGLSRRRASRSPLPNQARRALVVSPFLRRKTLDDIPVAWADLTVVSRPDELDRELAGFAEVSDGPTVLEMNPSAVDQSDESANSLYGLHAKIFAFDEVGSRSRVFTGSANATQAAFRTNVEVLLEMAGPTRLVGVGRWLAAASLCALLVDHTWQGEYEPAPASAEDTLTQVRKEVSALPLLGRVSPREDGRFDLLYEALEPLPDLRGAKLSVRPVSVKTWTQVPGTSLSASFPLGMLGLTAFLGVRLELDGEETLFTLMATLSGLPPDREARVLADLLADPERLVRYLLMLLFDPQQDRFDGSAQQALEHAKRITRTSVATVPLLEVMARALTRAPTRLAEIDRLIQDLQLTSGLVDDDLRALWDSIRTVAGLGGSQR